MSIIDDEQDWKMTRRRVVHVVNYLDECRQWPSDFVQRSFDGKYQAIVSYVPAAGPEDIIHQRLIGTFDTVEKAADAIRYHLGM